MHHAQEPNDDGEDPVPGVGEAGLPEGDEADGATDDGGEAEVEQDHHLLHLLGDQLGKDNAQGGHQTGTQHQTVPFRKDLNCYLSNSG